MLAGVALEREAVFVTNAVLCNPQSERGVNEKPTRTEIANCSHFLSSTIALVDPLLVIALGVSALAALGRVEQHRLTLRGDLARPEAWFNRQLAVLYHPSPRTRVFRSFAQQVADLDGCLRAARVLARSSRTR